MPELQNTSGNCCAWLVPPGPSVEWLDVTVEVAEPSPGAQICYTATSPHLKDA